LQPKSVLTRGRKSEFDNILDGEDSPLDESTEDTSQPNNSESATESCVRNFYCLTSPILASMYLHIYINSQSSRMIEFVGINFKVYIQNIFLVFLEAQVLMI